MPRQPAPKVPPNCANISFGPPVPQFARIEILDPSTSQVFDGVGEVGFCGEGFAGVDVYPLPYSGLNADPPNFVSNGGVAVQNGKWASVHKGCWDKSKGVEDDLELHRRNGAILAVHDGAADQRAVGLFVEVGTKTIAPGVISLLLRRGFRARRPVRS